MLFAVTGVPGEAYCYFNLRLTECIRRKSAYCLSPTDSSLKTKLTSTCFRSLPLCQNYSTTNTVCQEYFPFFRWILKKHTINDTPIISVAFYKKSAKEFSLCRSFCYIFIRTFLLVYLPIIKVGVGV